MNRFDRIHEWAMWAVMALVILGIALQGARGVS